MSENHLQKSLIAGLDEAGRGCLAGPVSVAIAVCRDSCSWGVTDSKKYSEKKREQLFQEAIRHVEGYAYVLIDHETIDQINIRQATLQGMRESYALIQHQLTGFSNIFIDGVDAPIPGSIAVVKGDQKIQAISAASIVAKVVRDRIMLYYHSLYPQYRFDLHKGYPTELHYQKIAEYGLSPIHRKTFCRKISSIHQ